MPAAFLSAQMDYVYFLYGSAFFLLAILGLSLHRLEGKVFPWRILSLFAVVHGAYEWLEILPMSIRDNQAWAAGRLAVMAVSFLLLAEFARAGSLAHGGRGPKRWILVPMVLLAGTGAFAGQEGLAATIRYFPGLAGGLWAAWSLFRHGRKSKGLGRRRAFACAASALAVYALATGAVVSKASFPPASLVNTESFLAFFGFPVQILRALAVCVLTAAVFRQYRAEKRIEDPATAGVHMERWMALCLAVILAAGWLVTETMDRGEDQNLRRQLLMKARTAVSFLDHAQVKILRWDESDLWSPDYRTLKTAILSLCASNPDLRSASLLGIRDGRIYALVDSESPGSAYYSPPGQEVPEADPRHIRGLSDMRESILGPVTDRRGTWMTCMVPVCDARFPGTSVSLALDVDAADWRYQVARARLPGITIALLIAAMLVLSFTVQQRTQAANARKVAALQRMHDQRGAILRLATSDAVTGGNFQGAARTIDEAAGRTLGVDRAGIWMGNRERGQFQCVDMYSPETGTHSEEPPIPVEPHRRYFEALEAGRVIDADQAQTDARTAEFRDLYLAPRGIVSLLDAPIRVGGRLAGLLRLEHVGAPRKWMDDEIRFAGETADQAAQALLNSDRRRDEEERLRLEEQVRHSQKLESLGVLAGGIAHDFNNLLMGILGNTELAMADVPASSPAGESLMEVQKTAHRAAELCQQMLAYAGRGRLVVEAVDLNALVGEMMQILEVSISKKAAMRFAFAPELPSLDADATQIRQIVMNLVINASEALGEGSGNITISTGCMDCDGAYLASTWLNKDLPEGRYVFLLVEDTGCGMDAETQARIFDPFFTTKFQGRGLGLAAVLGIVRGHRGGIKVESGPDRGTAIRILLPAGRLVADSAPMAPAEPAWRGSGTVLFVDDEPGLRALGRRLLERIGFSVLTAADGKECLDLYRGKPEGIACVILDLTMPVMDGAETLRELRRIRADVRVILSSGYNDGEIERRFAEERPSGFLQKPYRLASLIRMLRSVLGDAP